MNREYRVSTVREARAIGEAALREMELADAVSFGLPEIDDRYHIQWVPLKRDRVPIGEMGINRSGQAFHISLRARQRAPSWKESRMTGMELLDLQAFICCRGKDGRNGKG